MTTKFLQSLFVCASMLAGAPALAEDTIKIGVLNDQSGPFAAYQGIGSVIAAKMAVEDYGGKAGGKRVEVVAAMSAEKNKVFVGSGAGTALLTGEKCTPNTVHWT